VIAKGYRYAMLMASLPVHQADLFATSQTPLSRIRLDEHLKQLDAKDAIDLAHIEELLQWSKIADADDGLMVEKSKQIIAKIEDRFLRDLIVWRLELRTLVVALRKRHVGFVPDAHNPFIGIGQWPGHIQMNWQKPDFGLGSRLPWLAQANQLLATNQTLALEKLQLSIVWQHYARVSGQHYFDFPAVVIYVLRWGITHRWTLYHAETAVGRFDSLVEKAVAGFAL